MAQPRVLVYTATAGFRHDSIPTAIQTLTTAGPSNNISFDFTEDRSRFSDEGLGVYDGVMFVHNSDEVLDESGKSALQSYLQKGGNYIGVHAASACLFNTSFYGEVVGALFDYHPELQEATFLPLNTTHPAMANIPERWTFREEVYYFRSDPRSVGAEILMTVDESSYVNNGTSTGTYTQGTPHPISWSQTSSPASQPLSASAPGPGRSFYTSLGHTNETWQDETFIGHVMGGVRWVLEGGTTRAFIGGRGLVGNGEGVGESGSTSVGTATSTGTGAGGSTVVGASGTSSGTAAATSTAGAVRESSPGVVAVGVAAIGAAAGMGLREL